jgi:hypothetical protein
VPRLMHAVGPAGKTKPGHAQAAGYRLLAVLPPPLLCQPHWLVCHDMTMTRQVCKHQSCAQKLSNHSMIKVRLNTVESRALMLCTGRHAVWKGHGAGCCLQRRGRWAGGPGECDSPSPHPRLWLVSR